MGLRCKSCSSWSLIATALGALVLGPALAAAEEPASEIGAARLIGATVTVRVLPGKSDAAQSADAATHEAVSREGTTAEPAAPAVDTVTVASGVCVGPRRVVTFVPAEQISLDPVSRFRVTLAGGEQAQAELRVLDRFSGLALLEISASDQAFLLPAETLPAVGGSVLTASAAGVEKPAVSLGILSGVDRSPGASGLPPLLQCDVRTTETSSGAAIVNRAGELLGIIAATRLPGERLGWTYAIPARNVQRLLAAAAQDGARLVVLQRRRPVVGLTMAPGEREGTVAVEHVVPDGPAAAAGIRAGDVIVEADGRRIRSAYQVVDLILNRQPGETLCFVVTQSGQRKAIDVVLGGPAAAAADVRDLHAVAGEARPATASGPPLKVRVLGRNAAERGGPIEVQGHAAEVAVGGDAPAARNSPGDELEMLKIQLSAFERVIARLQDELKRRDEQQARTDETVAGLRRELDALRPATAKDAPAENQPAHVPRPGKSAPAPQPK